MKIRHGFLFNYNYLNFVLISNMRILLIILILVSFLSSSAQVKKNIVGDNVRRTSIYPNPARSFLHIQYQSSITPPSILLIYNFLGKKQFELMNPNSNVYIDLTDFSRGIYIFQFRDKNGRILETGKIQVEK